MLLGLGAAWLPARLDPGAAAAGNPATPAAGERESKPPDGYERALTLYRAEKFQDAAGVLEEAIRSGAGGRGYLALLGWCRLRMRRYDDAAAAFRAELKLEPGSSEARQGLALSLAGAGDAKGALEIALPLAAERPDDPEVAAIATRALGAARGIADRRISEPRPATPPVAHARAGRTHLEAAWKGRFVPLFVKGVNLGVALPGKFPAEFPEEVATYRDWLDLIGKMGANAVRLYTLLPPAFYDALKAHNDAAAAAGPDSATPPSGYLWLFQGVWTELPEGDDYDDPAFASAFLEEGERILDALHGRIAVAFRPGHAYGLYRSDVSAMTLGIILGREWEPYSVDAYDRAHPAARFRGRYFTMEGGTAMEAWAARMMERTVAYEMRRYGTTRPVAFTNWPTLDPLRHPTEATKAEEEAIARKIGLPYDSSRVREYDNDGTGIDADRIRATPEALGGQFASYHAYPYYPDFMNNDPDYARARDGRGPDNYIGYLRDLKRHHAAMPLMISEVGVPTSRGVAHVQPQGMNHGGHNEKAQGEIDARLMENIHDSGCAGGILFAWLDEWFKRNWLVMEFEKPAERNVKWLNALDPEQNYGLIAARPGAGGPTVTLDGKTGDWAGRSPLMSHGAADPGAPGLRAIWAASDEAYLYLRVDARGVAPGAEGGWTGPRFVIGIDTYGADLGDTSFPRGLALRAPTGMEFMVDLEGASSSRILVDTPYDLFTHRYDRPYRSAPNDDGRYIDIRVETNRGRIGRDGTIYPAVMHDLSPLRLGTTDPNAAAYDDLADWAFDAAAGVFEVRIPWGLLNVTDPSSRRVVDDNPASLDEVGTRVTDGFRIYAVAYDPASRAVLDTLPERGSDGRLAATASSLYAWKTWEEPTYHTRPKKSYDIVRKCFLGLPDAVTP